MLYTMAEDEIRALMMLCAAQGVQFGIFDASRFKHEKEGREYLERQLDNLRSDILKQKRERKETIEPRASQSKDQKTPSP